MTDQAERLRNLVRQRNMKQIEDELKVSDAFDTVDIIEERKRELTELAEEAPKVNARVIAVTSGKGGVGKTNVSINLAISMRKQNKRVVLLDTDFGLANVEVLLGVNPKNNFGDVLAGTVSIEAALTIGPMGVQFLSGGSGLTALSDITNDQMSVLIESFSYLDTMADVIIIDTGAGVSRSVVNFVKASREAVIVTTPDPTSVTDAYALIKTVKDASEDTELPVFKLVVNRVDNPTEGAEVYEKLENVCDRFLNIKLHSLGSIPHDKNLANAVKKQQPVLIAYPNTESSRCLEIISQRLLNVVPTEKKSSGFKSFVLRLTGKRSIT